MERKLIDLLFMRLGAIYGHIWTSRHIDEKAWEITKDEWGQALGNVMVQTIRRVLDSLRCSEDQYPPTLPMFIKMCRTESGIPLEEEAFQMALRREFNHPIAELCYQKIGSWDFTHDSEKVLKKKFSIAYNEAIKQWPLLQKRLEQK